ncbi:unnamed protein product [Rotaria sordida]|uniref:Peptidase S9 prolyl oligopeptidase catalytic domain-containing protein n=1 Tax=Rotaria sordida TaxID=392033 RepID=A0A814B4A1_9BILA|nr:unnamed protein product [Rotaria sordida]CAF0924040.1 unnamed protein product [Rotaria sordida]
MASTIKLKSKNYIIVAVAFLLGAIIVLIPCVIVISRKSIDCSSTSSEPSTWDANDYQSNSDYYDKLTITYDFNQTHNLRLDRLSSPCFHPINGKSVIYLRKQYHMPDLNGSSTTLHWIDLNTNKTIQLTRPIWGIQDQQFYWIDNKTILFLSNRASSGLTQLFQLNLPNDIKDIDNFLEPIQITFYSLNIDNLLVNRQGKRLVFSCQVYTNLSIEETFYRDKLEKSSGSFVYKFNKLFIRHWDEYIIGRRHHPFVVSIERNSKGIYYFSSIPKDILFNIDIDSPTRPFGDGKTQWSFSSTGNLFAYTRQHDETSDVAWTTNLDIYTVDLTSSALTSICITCENLAADTDPHYSPIDDQILVYRSQSIPSYEADQYKIKLINGSNPKITLLNDWDRSIQVITWSNDGQSLYLELGEEANEVIYKLSNLILPNPSPIRLLNNGTSSNINIHPIDNNIFLFTYENILQPSNIYLYLSSTSIRSITNHNKNLLSKTRMSSSFEKFSFIGANNEIVWGWHIPPINGTNQKAPLAFLIHGGPQNSWYNSWSYRWNFQSFSSQGYAVIAINFHGSDSYGQNFTNSIRQQYGTLSYQDLQLGLDAALNLYNYIDGNRAIALGGSYGGYMVNWIAGHTNMNQRFKAFVNHHGIFDMRHMAYSTDELWFIEYDAGGFAPYENPQTFEIYNPINYVANWTQPMLVIHGGYDYRVPDSQSISTFTALQRRGIPSRLLFFPTENHWVLNPFNSIIWYQEVLDWMNQWTK